MHVLLWRSVGVTEHRCRNMSVHACMHGRDTDVISELVTVRRKNGSTAAAVSACARGSVRPFLTLQSNHMYVFLYLLFHLNIYLLNEI